jgi:hypothetical protein
MTSLAVLSYFFVYKNFVKTMTSALLPSQFIQSLHEKQRLLLQHKGKHTSADCKATSSHCHVARSGNCGLLTTPGQRRDVAMWRRSSWMHLFCVLSLLGNITLTAATTGE